MKLLTKAQKEKMMKNYLKQQEAQGEGRSIDFKPVVKIFTPDAQAT